jgi:AcrR family transcriptional regulator
LLDAALSVIAEEGYGGVTIEAIARKAGVTRPVVYNLFHDLAELLGALLAPATRTPGGRSCYRPRARRRSFATASRATERRSSGSSKRSSAGGSSIGEGRPGSTPSSPPGCCS